MNKNDNLDKFSFISKDEGVENKNRIAKRNSSIENREIFSKLDEIITSINDVIIRLDKIDREEIDQQLDRIRNEYGQIITSYQSLVSQQDKSKQEKAKRFRFILITFIFQIISLFIGFKQGQSPEFQTLWVNLLKVLSGGL